MPEQDGGPPGTRAARLRAWAAGPEARAAVERLIAGGWLGDEPLVQACVVAVPGDRPTALVDWAALAQHARRLEAGGDARATELWHIYAVAARAWGGGDHGLGSRAGAPS